MIIIYIKLNCCILIVLKGKTNKVNPGKLDPKVTHVLVSLGFEKTQMENKQGQMTDYLVCTENAMRYVN